MQLTLHITNADENLLKALKSVVHLHPQATLKVKKKEDITANGYTEEFEKEIVQDLRAIEEQRKNGTLKLYNSVEEAFRAEGIIK